MAREKFNRNKPLVNVGTIGHVDHGQTTLTAALTKVVARPGKALGVGYDQIDRARAERAGGSGVASQSARFKVVRYRFILRGYT